MTIITKLLVVFCGFTFGIANSQNLLIDKKATPHTISLFNNLKKLSKDHVLFGHQNALMEGRDWGSWAGDGSETDKSDVKSVCGSHPAVVGVEICLFSGKHTKEEIEKRKEITKKYVLATYERGGVNTISWHFINPVSEDSFYWNDTVSKPAISMIKQGVLIMRNTRKF